MWINQMVFIINEVLAVRTVYHDLWSRHILRNDKLCWFTWSMNANSTPH